VKASAVTRCDVTIAGETQQIDSTRSTVVTFQVPADRIPNGEPLVASFRRSGGDAPRTVTVDVPRNQKAFEFPLVRGTHLHGTVAVDGRERPLSANLDEDGILSLPLACAVTGGNSDAATVRIDDEGGPRLLVPVLDLVGDGAWTTYDRYLRECPAGKPWCLPLEVRARLDTADGPVELEMDGLIDGTVAAAALFGAPAEHHVAAAPDFVAGESRPVLIVEDRGARKTAQPARRAFLVPTARERKAQIRDAALVAVVVEEFVKRDVCPIGAVRYRNRPGVTVFEVRTGRTVATKQFESERWACPSATLAENGRVQPVYEEIPWSRVTAWLRRVAKEAR
jgi:hypothetical protein